VQAIKAGVLEIADILAVNKADREGADKTVTALHMVLGSGPTGPRQIRHHGQLMAVNLPDPAPGVGWTPPIIKTVALRDQGIPDLVEAIEQHRGYLQASGEMERREEERGRTALIHILQAAVLRRLQAQVPAAQLQQLVADVARREIDPYRAAEQLLPAVLAAN
jgi:LAO/AO transport system kinase